MQIPSPHRVLAASAILTLACLAFPQAAEARGDVRLRVEITDAHSGDARVRLNVPLTSVDALMDVLRDQLDTEIDLDLDSPHHGVNLKKLYLSVRDEDVADLIEVNGDDGEHMRVWKDTDGFHLEVQERDRYEPNVRAYLPLPVLDALFDVGEGQRPDFNAALQELRRLAPLTLVEADDDGETVRVWLE